jgi:type IX secretion system PorP/SprF family membrane protein
MKKIFTLFLACFALAFVKAQDPHLTMFYNAPMQLNPALTGVFDGNYRMNALYRGQWGEILRDESVRQFRTIAAGADFRLPINKNAIGLGVAVMNDKAAQSEFGTTRAGFSMSYLQNLDKWGQHYLVMGLQADMIQRSFNPANLRFGNQWNGEQYDPTLPQDNPAYLASLNQNFVFFDAGVGMLYFYNSNKRNSRTSMYFGFSAQHVNRPNESFGSANVQLPIRYSMHSGVNFAIAKQFDLLPKYLFQLQGDNIETLFGTDIRYIFDPKDPRRNAFRIGTLYRMVGGLNRANDNSFVSESVCLITGVDFNGMTFGVAYDINISQFVPGTLTRGAFEVAVSYVGDFNKKRKDNTSCPVF